MLANCLNPPESASVEDALERVTRWGLLQRSDKQLQRATTFGALVAQLPLSLTAGRLVVIGAAAGLLAPAIKLGAILSTTPQPILKPFGEVRQALMLTLELRDLFHFCLAHIG